MTATKVPPITEKQFQAQVLDLARIFGWQWVHFRPAQTTRGWRTPVQGPLGEGWPDLILVHPKHGVRFIELKVGRATPTPEQWNVLGQLSMASQYAAVWMPGDLDSGHVEAVLKGER